MNLTLQALARVVYNHTDTIILDDPFSALDGKTERQIVENLVGDDSIFRKRNSTVLWITNNGKFVNLLIMC
jgi:ATP-binding cassette subfamily C (CFTR/MRP) protein 1